MKPNEKKPEHCLWTDEAYPHVVKCGKDCEKGCDKQETIAEMIADINRQKKGVWL
ncbi:unnamed protein product [marine sediment metagenome]|uniref:Uncharacterized protein n=1 Tax=marine sediment metagenome TaxID=412755 RepID=X1D1T0_9ZZZZ